MRGARSETTQRARLLRQSDNDAETKLWSELSDRRLNGFKFVRQYPIGLYFADFASREKHLLVELDGSQHLNSSRDLRRDAFMNDEGWSVVRFWNVDALMATSSVFETIVAICDGRLAVTGKALDLRFFPARDKS